MATPLYLTPRSKRRANSNYVKRHRAKGLCDKCSDPAVEKNLCKKHLGSRRAAARKSMAKKRKAWKALGFCHTCGAPHRVPGTTQCGKCAEDRETLHEQARTLPCSTPATMIG